MLDACGQFALFTDADQVRRSRKWKLLRSWSVEDTTWRLARGGARRTRGRAPSLVSSAGGKTFRVERRFSALAVFTTPMRFQVMKREVAQKIFHKSRRTRPSSILRCSCGDPEGIGLPKSRSNGCMILTHAFLQFPRAISIWLELFRINKTQKVVRALKARTHEQTTVNVQPTALPPGGVAHFGGDRRGRRLAAISTP